jgi:hypothetical protein
MMNERIRELAEQAEMAANKGNHVDVKIMMAKFAELIVQECAQYVEDKFDFCGDEIVIAEKLREHFGVE